MNLSLTEDWLSWGLGLMLGFPLLMVVLGEIILRLEKRQHPMVRVVRELRNWVFPLAALFFLFTRVLGLQKNQLPIQIIETLVWISLIVVALSFVNVSLFTGAKPNTWQAQMPKLFRDLVRTFLIVVGIAVVLSTVFEQDLGGLIAALGIGSVVIGLALQDTLGNLFSGVALLFERPFQVGDWLQVGDNKGRVIEINWRSVHIVTRNLEQLIVPNSVLAKEVIRNFNQPEKLHIEPVFIGFSYDDAPNKVKRVLLETALGTEGVLQDPEPVIMTMSYDDFSIAYQVRLGIADYAQVPAIRNAFITRIWYAARRNGLAIPFPIRDVYHHQTPKVSGDETLRRLANYMKSLSSLAMVEDSVLADMASQASLGHFGRGEAVIVQGQPTVKMHFVLAGSAIATFQDEKGKQHTVVEALGRGNFFGYSALLANELNPMTVTATEDLEVLILETPAVQNMLNRTPRFAQQLGAVIAARQNRLKAIQQASRSPQAVLTDDRLLPSA